VQTALTVLFGANSLYLREFGEVIWSPFVIFSGMDSSEWERSFEAGRERARGILAAAIEAAEDYGDHPASEINSADVRTATQRSGDTPKSLAEAMLHTVWSVHPVGRTILLVIAVSIALLLASYGVMTDKQKERLEGWIFASHQPAAESKSQDLRRGETANESTLPTCGLTISPGKIERGAAAQIRWSSTNAVRVDITPDMGAVEPHGSVTVRPQVTTTYTITAANATGFYARADATLEVEDSTGSFVPLAGTFAASPDTINPGEIAHLKWNSINATSLTITPDVGSVPAEGDVAVSPLVTTTYTLTMRNFRGRFGRGIAKVYVRGTNPGRSETPAKE
jgi:hypothetical protein